MIPHHDTSLPLNIAPTIDTVSKGNCLPHCTTKSEMIKEQRSIISIPLSHSSSLGTAYWGCVFGSHFGKEYSCANDSSFWSSITCLSAYLDICLVLYKSPLNFFALWEIIRRYSEAYCSLSKLYNFNPSVPGQGSHSHVLLFIRNFDCKQLYATVHCSI